MHRGMGLTLLAVLTLAGNAQAQGWEQVLPGRVRGVVFDRVDRMRAYAGLYDGQLVRSVDGGLSWIDAGLPGYGNWALEVNAADPSTVYAGLYTGIAVSKDAGVTWSARGDIHIPRRILVNPLFPTSLFVFTWGGVYVSEDEGVTSSLLQIAPGVPAPDTERDSLNVDYVHGIIYYLMRSSMGGNYDAHAYRSADGGLSWTYEGIWPDPIYGSIVMDPSDPYVLYSSNYGGNFKTTDGGANWTQLRNPVVFVHPTSPNVVYGNQNGALVKSRNGGICWEPDSPNIGFGAATPQSIASDGVATILAGGDPDPYFGYLGGLWRTVDEDVAGFPADVTPPALTASSNPVSLWPPGNSAVPVTITASASDPETCVREITINGVAVSLDAPSRTLNLVPEHGTVYRIPVTATDAAGHTATFEVVVPVAH